MDQGEASIVSATPLTDRCATHFQRGEHACFGISPFNGYFTPQRITRIAEIGLSRFDAVHFYVPDGPATYTLEALGYSEERAAWKARRQGRYVRNKICTALRSLGVDEPDRYVLDSARLDHNNAYTELLRHVHDLYRRYEDFREACVEASRWVLDNRLPPGQEPTRAQLERAVCYLLAELPLFIDTAAIVGVSSSVFCYHQVVEFLLRLYGRQLRVQPSSRQGFLVLEMSDEALVAAAHA